MDFFRDQSTDRLLKLKGCFLFPRNLQHVINFRAATNHEFQMQQARLFNGVFRRPDFMKFAEINLDPTKKKE